ncbi:hypothetical protein Ddye_020212 [Dipteronia dyeriana]|uniref:Glycoprotein n=1 Tax=Dipteronia dyeriana TaxID=168575 RepID=A0AAD9WWF9_9ROSI|nr:hypothetical protein Ddye_020212 [Dipteronia dyeriana]
MNPRILLFVIWSILLFGRIESKPKGPNEAAVRRSTRDTQIAISELHLAPLAKCSEKTVSAELLTVQCLDSCRIDLSTGSTHQVKVYNAHQEVSKVEVAVCHKVEASQTFTKTWTFSKIKSKVDIKELPISEIECRSEWEKVCNKGPCMVAGNETVPESYSWASETIKTISTISIRTIPGVRYQETGGEKMSLQGSSPVPFSDKFLQKSDHEVLVWEDQTVVSHECEWKDGHLITCIFTKDNIWCPTQGIWLDNATTFTSATSHCQDKQFFVSAQGIVWSDEGVSKEGVVTTDKKIFLDLPDGATEKDEYIVRQTNKILAERDELTCIKSCLDVSSLIHKPNSLITAGRLFYYVRTDIGPLEVCEPAWDCSVEKNPRVCAVPLLVELKCKQGLFWWDPDSPIIPDMNPSCHSFADPMRPSLTLASRLGTITVNETGAYLHPNKKIVQLGGMHLNYGTEPAHPFNFLSTLQRIRGKEADARMRPSRIIGATETVSGGGLHIPSLFNSIVEWLEDAEHTIKVYAVSILVVLVGGWFLKFYFTRWRV